MAQYFAYLEHNEERVQKELTVARSKESNILRTTEKKQKQKEGTVGNNPLKNSDYKPGSP